MSPYGAAEATLDLREGGTFRITMLSEGTSIEHSGRYLVIQPPERLVFTWESPYTGPEPSRVSVTLRPHPEGTLLTLAHERLPVEEVASHEGGWGQILDQLTALLAASSPWVRIASDRDKEHAEWT